MRIAANRIFGTIDGNFDRPAGSVKTVSGNVYSQQGLYISYTSRRRV
jgi:hypothetical protein